MGSRGFLFHPTRPFQFGRSTHTRWPPLPKAQGLEASVSSQAQRSVKLWGKGPGSRGHLWNKSSRQPAQAPGGLRTVRGSWYVLRGRSEAQAAQSGDAQLGESRQREAGLGGLGPPTAEASSSQSLRAGGQGHTGEAPMTSADVPPHSWHAAGCSGNPGAAAALPGPPDRALHPALPGAPSPATLRSLHLGDPGCLEPREPPHPAPRTVRLQTGHVPRQRHGASPPAQQWPAATGDTPGQSGQWQRFDCVTLALKGKDGLQMGKLRLRGAMALPASQALWT